MRVSLQLTNPEGRPRNSCVIEQGIPVLPMEQKDVERLRLQTESGASIPANIEHDGRDENGKTVWVRLTAAVDIPGEGRSLFLVLGNTSAAAGKLRITNRKNRVSIANDYFTVDAGPRGNLSISTAEGPLVDGPVDFHAWPDARSIIGAGAGTNRLAFFEPDEWQIENQSHARSQLVLSGKIPKYAAYTGDPEDKDPDNEMRCELELTICAFSNIIRYRWRMENYTSYQVYLERYTLVLPLARGARIEGGERSGDGKFLRYIQARAPGGTLAMTAGYVDVLGAGAGINPERRESLGERTVEELADYARRSGQTVFDPHRYLHAESESECGLNIVSGGVNPPQDARQWADNPQVHRLFYRGMGRTFEGSLVINGSPNQIQDELSPVYFELEPDYYSQTGALPENGDPVYFGEFRDLVFTAAEWLLKEQWKGTLWWGEWWREYDVLREQGIEATANGNNPLGPLYHYWRTGDGRFIEPARRSLDFQYDIQLCKKGSTCPVPFFHSRRYLMDQMEWVHMRYQRLDGPVKAAHFFGDTRLRQKIIAAMSAYASLLVMPNGAPGYWENVPRRVSVAGSDCANFCETLSILYRETGNPDFLVKARKMADWLLRKMGKWDWDADIGNSYGWHFPMRGMLSVINLTGSERYKKWYIDLARKNLTYPVEEMDFRPWMDWLLTEAGKMSPDDEGWFLDEMLRRTQWRTRSITDDGAVYDQCNFPWSKWPSLWQRLYDQKTIVSYIPVLSARRKALGLQ